jgi:death-on-curing protein
LPRGRRHYRITLGDALSAHEEALTYGGLPGINSLALIESAIARPYTGYYRRIAQKSAALLQSVASNHGFIDGNKRTALILVNLLLRKSGYGLTNGDDPKRALENTILAVVKRELEVDALVRWFERRLARRAD